MDNNMILLSIIPSIITALIAGGATYIVAKINKKGTIELRLVTELQAQVDRLNKRVDLQSNKIDILFKQNLSKDEYITLLRQHIILEYPPPPPEYPHHLKCKETDNNG